MLILVHFLDFWLTRPVPILRPSSILTLDTEVRGQIWKGKSYWLNCTFWYIFGKKLFAKLSILVYFLDFWAICGVGGTRRLTRPVPIPRLSSILTLYTHVRGRICKGKTLLAKLQILVHFWDIWPPQGGLGTSDHAQIKSQKQLGHRIPTGKKL